MQKTSIIKVQNTDIAVITSGDGYFICLTDIAKTEEGDSRAADIIKNWIRNRATLEFLSTWEQLYNPECKVVKFDHFKMNARRVSEMVASKTNVCRFPSKIKP